MEQTLTPPPSFRALRVLPRVRQSTVVDENCPPRSPTSVKMSSPPCSLVEPCSPASRGRTRTRTIRGAHVRPSAARAKPKLQISLPAPMLKKNGALSPADEEELIFQMSPILSQSPTRIFLTPVDELRSEPLRVQQSAMQTLSALWEKQKALARPEVIPPPKSSKLDSQKSTKNHKRSRTGTVTQHNSSDNATRAARSSRRRATENVKAPFDLSSALHAHSTPSSPERSNTSLYSFPSIEFLTLTKAQKNGEERPAKEGAGHDERHSTLPIHTTKTVEIEGEDFRRPLAEAAQNIGPIRARKLRLQNGETLDDNESSNFISNAFRSASLQSTQLISESDDGVETDYEDSFFSHDPSSASSSEIATADHSVCSSEISNSLLESFPIRVPSTSPSQSSSRSRHERFDEMLQRLRAMRDGTDARSELGSISEAEALRVRGRPRMTHFRRMSEQVQMHANTGSPQREGHGRAREPVLTRKSGSSVHSTSAAFDWSAK